MIPLKSLGFVFTMFKLVSLLMVVLYELDCLSISALCSKLMHSTYFLKYVFIWGVAIFYMSSKALNCPMGAFRTTSASIEIAAKEQTSLLQHDLHSLVLAIMGGSLTTLMFSMSVLSSVGLISTSPFSSWFFLNLSF
jgi:hypothetical protein